MKDFFNSVILLAGLILLAIACQNNVKSGNQSHSHGPDSHSHEEGSTKTLNYLLKSENIEFYVEFPLLITGQDTRFVAHITRRKNFKPVDQGLLVVRLWKEKQKIAEAGVPKPSSPGIFMPKISCKDEGMYELEFTLIAGDLKDTFRIEGIKVYPSVEIAEMENPEITIGDDISFTLNQAWMIDFSLEAISKESIYNIIHTSGEILTAQGENKVLSSKSHGIVSYKNKKLQEGSEVKKGEVLFSINSAGMVNSNLLEQYKTAKAKVENTKADFNRAETLLNEEIIGRKEYEQRKMEYEISKAEFETINSGFSSGGNSLTSPLTGILKNVYVKDGEFVEEGIALAEISSNRRLVLEADLSQQYFQQINQIKSANFKTPYMQEVQSIDDFNGQLISKGRIMDEDGFIPILFELDNKGALLPGSFAEIFIQTNILEDVIVVPNSAIMQDYEVQFVYVQTGGETFEKRVVILGITDGEKTQVLKGLQEGEWIVTEGAYQIKIASLSTTIPGHGHEH